MQERVQATLFLFVLTLAVILAMSLPVYRLAQDFIRANPVLDLGPVKLTFTAAAANAAAEAKRRYARQLQCLADNIYYESRGEPYRGQVAVARVTMNRVAAGFAKDVCGVVYQGAPKGKAGAAYQVGGCQFSWLCGGEELRKPDPYFWNKAYDIAVKVMLEKKYETVVPNALFFHANYVVHPYPQRVVYTDNIGNHRFYRFK